MISRRASVTCCEQYLMFMSRLDEVHKKIRLKHEKVCISTA